MKGGFIRNLKFLELLQMGGGLIFQHRIYIQQICLKDKISIMLKNVY